MELTMGRSARTSPNLKTSIALRAVALAMAAGITLASCGGGSGSDASSRSSSSSITTEAAAVTEVSSSTTTAQTISATSAAAEAFLATLSVEQRDAVLYAWDDRTKTTTWSNFPVKFVERAGLNLNDLTDEQKTAAMKVLKSLLSDEAYETVVGIIGGDEYLHENSSSAEESLGQYYIAFFGDPSDTSAFEVQFGGHHLGINASVDGEANTITFAPTHLGIQPAVYTDADGNEVQPFDGIYTDAFAFYDSLTDEQKTTLTASGTGSFCAAGDTCDFSSGTGLKGSDLTDKQKQVLLDLVANWAAMSDAETNATALAKIEATLDDTYVSWSGATEYDLSTGDGVSFLVSGPDVYVGFEAQQGSAGADVDGVSTSGWGHVHTLYRDPTNDYADSVTQQAATGGMGGGGGAPSGEAPGGAAPATR